jgi:hypothetical protein
MGEGYVATKGGGVKYGIWFMVSGTEVHRCLCCTAVPDFFRCHFRSSVLFTMQDVTRPFSLFARKG